MDCVWAKLRLLLARIAGIGVRHAVNLSLVAQGLPSDITEEELQFVFKAYGNVKSLGPRPCLSTSFVAIGCYGL